MRAALPSIRLQIRNPKSDSAIEWSELMKTFLKDVRFGLRVLWKSKGVTAVAVLTLSLGISVNTAIFSGVSALVLRTLPGVEEPEGLVSLFEASRDGRSGYNDFSYAD